MKITLDLPDDLLIDAKAMATRRNTTLKDMVAHALRREIASPLVQESDDEMQRKAALKHLLESMQASNAEPMVPLKREEIYDR